MSISFSNRVYMKLHRLLSRIGVAQRIAVCLSVRVGGRLFRIPVVQSVGLGNVGMGDWWALDIYSKLLADCPGTFLDVGANIGQTLLKVKSCSSDRAWIGFEPNPICVMYLEKLIEANRFKSCILIPAGLDTENGVKGLDCFGEDPADQAATLVEHFRPDQKIIQRKWVAVLNFAALSRAGINETIGFVKIDVEGGEKEVLASLDSVLAKSRPIVMLEVLPVWSVEHRERLARQQAVEKQFRDLNYTICRIEKSPDGHCAGVRPLPEIGIHNRLTWSDYLVVPSEKLEGALARFGHAEAEVE